MLRSTRLYVGALSGLCKGQLVFHMLPSVVARCVYVILLQLTIAVANAGAIAAEMNEQQLFLKVNGKEAVKTGEGADSHSLCTEFISH